ncbi:MAG: glycine cleavage system aminomethyltransferase GcvT [Verrucomicrobiota bacterium]
MGTTLLVSDTESILRRTSFFETHVAASARIVDFAGWEMPVSYRGILEEHRQVRDRVGVFDVSHMGEFMVSGSQADEFLDYVLTNRIGNCPPGKAVYSPMCNEAGGVVDDLIAYRLTEDSFLVVVNASNREKDWRWMNERSGLFDVSLADESEDWALLAVQGPQAVSYLNDVLEVDWSGVKRFHLLQAEVAGISIVASRTGYTGEDGFELFVRAENALELAKRLKAGDTIEWIGLGARDSLRLEAGLPLYGHELTEQISPVAAGFGWAVKEEKPRFVGKDALQLEKQIGSEQTVRFFTVGDRRIAREEMLLYSEDEEIGKVLSGSKSPILDKPIGSALIDASFTGDTAEVDSRGKRLPVIFAKPPLHR